MTAAAGVFAGAGFVEQQCGPPADSLERFLEPAPFGGREIGERLIEHRDVLAEHGLDQFSASGGEGHDADPAIVGAFDAAHQPLGMQSLDGHAD